MKKVTPPKTAKGNDSTPANSKKRKGASKKKGKKGASKKKKGADDGSDADTGSESWPSTSSEFEIAD